MEELESLANSLSVAVMNFSANLDELTSGATGRYVGAGATRDAAIRDAWSRVRDADKKKAGLQIAKEIVGGGNPIRWYGIILEER